MGGEEAFLTESGQWKVQHEAYCPCVDCNASRRRREQLVRRNTGRGLSALALVVLLIHAAGSAIESWADAQDPKTPVYREARGARVQLGGVVECSEGKTTTLYALSMHTGSMQIFDPPIAMKCGTEFTRGIHAVTSGAGQHVIVYQDLPR